MARSVWPAGACVLCSCVTGNPHSFRACRRVPRGSSGAHKTMPCWAGHGAEHRRGLCRSELPDDVIRNMRKNNIDVCNLLALHHASGQVYSLLRPPQDEVIGMHVPGEFRAGTSTAMAWSSACAMCGAMRLDASAEALLWNPTVLPEADVEAFNSVDGEGLSPAVCCLKQVASFCWAHAVTWMFALTECPLLPPTTGISTFRTHAPTPACCSAPRCGGGL